MLNNKTKSTIGAILLLVLILGASSLYKNYRQKKTKGESKSSETIVVEHSKQGFEKFFSHVSQENQDAYVAQINDELTGQNLSNWDRDLLMIRQAVALSIFTGDITREETSATLAMGIFRRFVSSTEMTPAAIYLRDFSIVAGTKLQLQLKAYPALTLIDPSAPNFVAYKKAGYSTALTTELALHDLAKTLSAERQNDIVNTGNMMVLESIIIATEKNTIKPETYQMLLTDLGNNLKSSEQERLKPFIFTDDISTNIEPKFQYALGYDMYHFSVDQPSSKVNSAIDKNYEAVFEKVSQDPGFGKNDILSQVAFYSQITYLDSINRRYGDTSDTNQINRVVDRLLVSIYSSKQLEGFAANYLKSSAKDSPAKNFLALGKKNKNVADYISTLGFIPTY